MAHFVKIENGGVVRVEVVANAVITDEQGVEQEQLGIDFLRDLYGEPEATWVQCSYNGSFRGGFPGAGWMWRADLDAFIAPQPHPSWTLSGTTWEPPVAYPDDDGGPYMWNEDQQTWDEV